MNKKRETEKSYQAPLDFAMPQPCLKPPTVAKRRTASRSRRRLLLIDYRDWLALVALPEEPLPASA
jgi:hypothetical protein